MVFGIGTDILDRERLDRGLDEAFICRVYTQAEQSQAGTRTNGRAFYATRFAAKEAVFKALSPCLRDFRPRDIQTLVDENGKPVVTLHGRTAAEVDAYLAGRPYTIALSVSCEEKTAIAFAVVQTAEDA